MTDGQQTMPQTITRDNVAGNLGVGAIPDGYIPFRGYLAAGEPGTHRIFVDGQFMRWLVVNTADIAARLDVSGNASDPRDLVWVKRGARIAHCQVRFAHEVADDGCGVDTEPPGPPPPY